jgi:segregation and condensation protein B
VVQARKPVTRFPLLWTPELRQRSLAIPVAAQSKIAVRLPARWADFIRAHPHGARTAIPVSTAENFQVRRPAVRLPSLWAERIRASQVLSTTPSVERISLTFAPSKEYDVNTKRIVEAILFAANRPMSIKQIQEAFPEFQQPDAQSIQAALEGIARDYAEHSIGLTHLASGYRFQVKEGFSFWVTRLFEEKPPRYSRALLETLSIIAYRQPVTRGDIEDIRGVTVSTSIIQTMLEREWIRVIGHKEVPGRPALYGTTKQFLDYFNLKSLNELPTLQEIVDTDFGPSAPTQSNQQENRERPQTDLSETSGTEPQASIAQTSGLAQAETDDEFAESPTLH